MTDVARRELLQGMAAALSLAGCAGPGALLPAGAKADTILYRGRIYTVDARDTVVEALAIKDGRIVATGTNEAVRALAGPGTREIDLGGKAVVPGFIDAHPHLDGVGMGMNIPSFKGAKSVE